MTIKPLNITVVTVTTNIISFKKMKLYIYFIIEIISIMVTKIENPYTFLYSIKYNNYSQHSLYILNTLWAYILSAICKNNFKKHTSYYKYKLSFMVFNVCSHISLNINRPGFRISYYNCARAIIIYLTFIDCKYSDIALACSIIYWRIIKQNTNSLTTV